MAIVLGTTLQCYDINDNLKVCGWVYFLSKLHELRYLNLFFPLPLSLQTLTTFYKNKSYKYAFVIFIVSNYFYRCAFVNSNLNKYIS